MDGRMDGLFLCISGINVNLVEIIESLSLIYLKGRSCEHMKEVQN